MSVEQLLAKVQTHNTGVRACILSSGNALYHTLVGNYEVIEPGEFVELADRMLELADAAPELGDGSDTAFVEYDNHSVFVRRVGEGVLIVVTDPMNMSGFKKINVGINLFLKPMMKALGEMPDVAAPAAVRSGTPSPMVLRADEPIGKSRNPQPAAAPETPAEPADVPRYARGDSTNAASAEDGEKGKKKKVRFYRGVAY